MVHETHPRQYEDNYTAPLDDLADTGQPTADAYADSLPNGQAEPDSLPEPRSVPDAEGLYVSEAAQERSSDAVTEAHPATDSGAPQAVAADGEAGSPAYAVQEPVSAGATEDGPADSPDAVTYTNETPEISGQAPAGSAEADANSAAPASGTQFTEAATAQAVADVDSVAAADSEAVAEADAADTYPSSAAAAESDGRLDSPEAADAEGVAAANPQRAEGDEYAGPAQVADGEAVTASAPQGAQADDAGLAAHDHAVPGAAENTAETGVAAVDDTPREAVADASAVRFAATEDGVPAAGVAADGAPPVDTATDAPAAGAADTAVVSADSVSAEEPAYPQGVAASDATHDEIRDGAVAEDATTQDAPVEGAVAAGAAGEAEAAAASAGDEPVETAPAVVPQQRGGTHDAPAGLWSSEAVADLHSRWEAVQLRFVDDPAGVAAQARALVTEAAEALQAAIAQRAEEAAQWQAGDDTEELRQLVGRLRQFFDLVVPR